MTRVIRGERHNSSRFAFSDFETQAGAARQRANAQALEILRAADIKAKRAAEQAREQARHAGIQEGRALGMEAIRSEAWERVLSENRQSIAGLIQTLNAAVEQIESGKRRVLAESETGVIRIALAIAQRICKRLATRGGDLALANARHLVERIRNHHDAQLRFHPEDLQLIRAVHADWCEHVAQQRHVSIVPDPSLPRGGCALTSSAGRIDADIETQIERIAAALLGDESPAEDGPVRDDAQASRFIRSEAGDAAAAEQEAEHA